MRLLTESTHSGPRETKKVQRDYASESQSGIKQHNGARIVRKERPNDLSRSEIRSKIENHKREKEKDFQVEIDASKAKKKAEVIKNATKAKVEVTPEGEPFGDVKKNDPNDPGTKEKLKGVLTAGAFNFSAKERDVLSKILKD